MLRFGTLGTAAITPRALIYPCADEPRAMIRCVAARDRERAEGFAKWHHIPVVHDSYDEVVNDPKINAVYNPLPISMHCEWTIKALRAGKHVLCEKSFASNANEAREMADVAKETGLKVMDAFHYRYHPVFIRAKEIIDTGMLGTVRNIDAAFHIPVTDPNNIRNIYRMGGGVTMDIGCYPISWVRHLTGEEPEEVSATAETGAENVDTYLATTMRFPSGIEATTSGDMREGTQIKMEFTVTGDQGSMRVMQPLVPQNGHAIELTIGGEKSVETRDRRATYGYQLDAFIAAVEEDAPMYTDAEDGVKQMALIDRCYEAAGLPARGLDL